MSYKSKDLSVLAYTNGFTLWHYRTHDSATVVTDEGYFNPKAEDLLRAGDILICNVDTADVPQALLLLVKKVEGLEVTVHNMTGKQE